MPANITTESRNPNKNPWDKSTRSSSRIGTNLQTAQAHKLVFRFANGGKKEDNLQTRELIQRVDRG